MKSNILFVDDQALILNGLKRSLRSQNNTWDMHFATSGAEALEFFEKDRVDVIITDMRMPEMDGATLLEKVEERSPDTVRMILSGQCDREAVFRAVGPSHQYLSKPCDPSILIKNISKSLRLRQNLSCNNIQKIVSKMRFLPSIPKVYKQILSLLSSETATSGQVSKIISTDISLMAKFIQIANSDFFGIHSCSNNLDEIIQRLGIDTVRALVLTCEIGSIFNERNRDIFNIYQYHAHNLELAKLAAKIARIEGCTTREIDEIFIAAVLHNIGVLVLATQLFEAYQEAITLADFKKISILEAEEEIFGVNHSAVGAYLLGIWGYPDDIVEVAAYYYNPMQSGVFFPTSPLTIVHGAKSILNQCGTYPLRYLHDTMALDKLYLQELDVNNKVVQWSAVYHN